MDELVTYLPHPALWESGLLYETNRVSYHIIVWLTAYTSVTVPMWSVNFCRQPPATAGLSEGSNTLRFPPTSPTIINPLATDIEVRGTSEFTVLKGECMFVSSYVEWLLFRFFSKCAPTSHRSTFEDCHPLMVARIPGSTQTADWTASTVLMVTLGEIGGGSLFADRVAKSQTWGRKIRITKKLEMNDDYMY